MPRHDVSSQARQLSLRSGFSIHPLRMHMLRFLCLLALLPLALPAQDGKMAQRLAEALKRYPEADLNRDGQLSVQEGLTLLQKLRGESAPKKSSKGPTPTLADQAYGPHERHRLDFWKSPSASATGPAPVVVFIHGGGFVGGDKAQMAATPQLSQLLQKGVSCASINYRFRQHAPIQEILRDTARAVQFIRYKAAEWGVDKARIAAFGSSAGAGSSLWLNCRDDLARPDSEDPVLRESSRVIACVINATQATYDLTRWESFLGPANPAWSRHEDEGPAFYGFKSSADFTTDAGRAVLRECDMLSWISPDDGPVMATVRMPDGPIKDRGHWLHHPKHAEEIQKCCLEAMIECVVARDAPADQTVAFLLKALRTDTTL